MRTNQIKLFIVIAVILTLAAVTFNAGWTRAFPAKGGDDDVAALYKSKCAACHTAKAEKFFDFAQTDEVLTEIILKGKKAAKPPNMPAFEKSITPVQAKSLVAYMRQLRAPAASNSNVNTTANVNSNANINSSVNANTQSNMNANITVANVNTSAANVTSANTNVNVSANANINVNANTNIAMNTNAAVNVNAVADNGVNPKLAAEIAQIYKTKCAVCHSPKAEKFFDPSLANEPLAEVILKGKKGAKPPNMPAFAEKGVTSEYAAELVKYMKSLRASGK